MPGSVFVWSVENCSAETLSVTVTFCLRGYEGRIFFVLLKTSISTRLLGTLIRFLVFLRIYIFIFIEATSAEPFEVNQSNVNITGMKIHNVINSNKCSFAYGARETVNIVFSISIVGL